jgi:YQGE family putative transporter
VGVLIFIGCLLLAKPLLDLAYYPIQFRWSTWFPISRAAMSTPISSTTSSGCFWDELSAVAFFSASPSGDRESRVLKYALPVIALLQLLSIRVAGQINRDLIAAGNGNSPAASFIASKMEA